MQELTAQELSSAYPEDLLRQACDICQHFCNERRAIAGMLFRIRSLENCAKSVCCMKVSTMARRIGCSVRTVHNYLAWLSRHSLVNSVRSNRCALRSLSRLGRAVVGVLSAGGPLFVLNYLGANSATPVADQSADHIQGGVKRSRITFSCSEKSQASQPTNPADRAPDYRQPYRTGRTVSDSTWGAVLAWIRSDGYSSLARCKVAQRAFTAEVGHFARHQAFGQFSRRMGAAGRPTSADELFGLAVQDAVKRKKPFCKVESALKYAVTIVCGCINETRLPGERRRC